MGIIIVSDDLPELLQNTDRILVMLDGRLVREFETEQTSEDQLYQAMLAVKPELVH
jgi:simple sugar transport system ATP-binding protein